MKKLLIIIFVLFFTNIEAQNFSLVEAIRLQFSEQEQAQLDIAQEEIKKGDKFKEQGENILNEAQQMKTEANKIKRKKKRKKQIQAATQKENSAYIYLIKGSKKYAEANSTIYNLYTSNLSTLADNIPEPEKSQLLELMQKAASYNNQAYEKRKKANSQSIKKLSYENHAEAEQLEKQAIATLMEAYSLYFRKIEEQKNQPPPEEEPRITPKDTAEQQTVSSENIIFRVQIAASEVPLSENKLKKIYPDFKFAYVDKDQGWYKYLVGEYKTYEQAYKAKKDMNVKGAFIVAYKDGIRVKNIREVCNPEDHPALHLH